MKAKELYVATLIVQKYENNIVKKEYINDRLIQAMLKL